MKELFGFSNYPLWTTVSAVVVVLMGLGGPIGYHPALAREVRGLGRAGHRVWLAYHLSSRYDLHSLILKAGDGSLPYWQAVDLVIALPISWLPLVADYNRFGRRTAGAFWGTALGFFATSSWFLVMGAFLMLGENVKQEPKDFAAAIALIAGWGALLILLADETHNAWADIYSAAVSTAEPLSQGEAALADHRLRRGLPGAAVVLDITKYQGFLYLLGSFFIPLFGVLAADYFVVRRSRPTEAAAEGRAEARIAPAGQPVEAPGPRGLGPRHRRLPRREHFHHRLDNSALGRSVAPEPRPRRRLAAEFHLVLPRLRPVGTFPATIDTAKPRRRRTFDERRLRFEGPSRPSFSIGCGPRRPSSTTSPISS